jgi:hypothetical protein
LNDVTQGDLTPQEFVKALRLTIGGGASCIDEENERTIVRNEPGPVCRQRRPPLTAATGRYANDMRNSG